MANVQRGRVSNRLSVPRKERIHERDVVVLAHIVVLYGQLLIGTPLISHVIWGICYY